MSRLKDKYIKSVIPAYQQKFGISNYLAVPKAVKVTINVGVGRGLKEPGYTERVADNLSRICGQKPVLTKARKAISNFKIRQGMTVGVKITLRGQRMYDFLDKLIHVALPRLRDFHGLDPRKFDGQGNYSLGFAEHLAFPEIKADEVEIIHGLEVTITTTAKSDEAGLFLLSSLGFPFATKGESERENEIMNLSRKAPVEKKNITASRTRGGIPQKREKSGTK